MTRVLLFPDGCRCGAALTAYGVCLTCDLPEKPVLSPTVTHQVILHDQCDGNTMASLILDAQAFPRWPIRLQLYQEGMDAQEARILAGHLIEAARLAEGGAR